MARVSLIPLFAELTPWPSERLASLRNRLVEAGYAVEVAATPGNRSSGLVRAMVDQLRCVTGDLMVVVDLAMPYPADDVVAVVRRLEMGSVSLVVATRPRRWSGRPVRRLMGTADPTSGLVGLSREAVIRADRSFAPVGSRFTCELLARVDGARADLEVGPVDAPHRAWAPMNDIRHLKRIADDRLGNLSRLLQFCSVGASGMVVDLSAYAALLALLSRTPLGSRLLFQMTAGGSPVSLAVVVAAVLAIAIAMTWNFSLNRRLTFNDARRGSVGSQYLRYVLSNLAGVGVSLTFRLLLPGSIAFFARHRLLAAVAGIVAATGISFSLSRWFVFASRPEKEGHRAGSDHAECRLDPGHAKSLHPSHDLTHREATARN